MKDNGQFVIEYLTDLSKALPTYLFVGQIGIFFVGALALFMLKGIKNRLRWCIGLLLVEYVIIIYCSTVVFRFASVEAEYDFMPFWSYKAYLKGDNPKLLLENIMNVVVFVPIGILLGIVNKEMKWRYVWYIGSILSISIEILQYFTKRGFAELDDVIHNTLGCAVGYAMYLIVNKVYGYYLR